MPAPRGLPLRQFLFDDEARPVAAYEPDLASFGVHLLWCEGARVYLFGFGSFRFADSINHKIDPDSRLSRLFPANQTPTGNVIDFSRGTLLPVLTREQSYGSSGGIEDNPCKLR